MMPGCCVVVLREGNIMPYVVDLKEPMTYGNVNLVNISGYQIADSPIAIVCWRGKATMNVLVSPPDRKELLEYLFGIKAFKVEDEKSNKNIDALAEGSL